MESKGNFSKEELKRRLDGGELDLSLCSIVKVPVKQISNLQKVTVLDLSCNMVSELQDSFCFLVNLEQLDLSKNSLISLPENFGNLKMLRRLDLYSNSLITLPLSFGDLKLLKWLDLKDNPIQKDLYDIVGDCLDQKECEKCAKRMLNFMQDLKTQEERRRTAELEKERRKKATEDLELQKLQEAKKQEKKDKKEKRKKAYLEQQSKKEAELHSKEGLSPNNYEGEDRKIADKVDLLSSKDNSSVFVKLFWMILVALLGAVIFHYKDEMVSILSKATK